MYIKKDYKPKLINIQIFLNEKHPNGKCLSLSYNTGKLLWECQYKHIWETTAKAIFAGEWCPACANIKRRNYNQAYIIDYLNNNYPGGKLLDNYELSHSIYNWECANNHIFKNSFKNIKNRNDWCPICRAKERAAGNKNKFENLLKEKHPGSICLNYINCRTKANFICEYGHNFAAMPTYVMDNHWCHVCWKTCAKTIRNICNFLNEKHPGSICLEKSNKFNYKIKCRNNHLFNSSFGKLKNGHWCKICNVGYGEKLCRKAFELLFNNNFPNVRPNFLKRKHTKRNLELDGFCEELKIAFEYQGEQHYKIIPGFRGNEITLKKQQERDAYKKQKCQEFNVKLIEIPQFTKNFKPEHLKNYIIEKCFELNIDVPNINIDMDYIVE